MLKIALCSLLCLGLLVVGGGCHFFAFYPHHPHGYADRHYHGYGHHPHYGQRHGHGHHHYYR